MLIYFLVTAALLYGVCAALGPQRRGLISAITALAWLVHGAGLYLYIGAQDSVRLGFAMMLSSALWVSVLAYWIENRNFSLDGLRRLVMPAACVAALLPLAFPGTVLALGDRPSAFAWHVVIAIMAYSTITIAAFHAALMTLQEAHLHTRGASVNWLAGTIDNLPALLTMERLLFRVIGIGFALLTLTVLSGVVFSEQLFGQAMKWDHKTVFALLSWMLFGALLAGRKWRGWRGKTALRFTLAGFVTLLFAYVGSRFVLEVVLHRGLA